jgi:hypothetical protein
VIASPTARALCLGALLAIADLATYGAEANEAVPSTATPATLGTPVSVGPVTGMPEYDSIGFVGSGTCTPSPIYSAQPKQISTGAGGPEWDTYGFVLEGEHPCIPSDVRR